MRDFPLSIPEGKRKEARTEAKRVVNYMRKCLFPGVLTKASPR